MTFVAIHGARRCCCASIPQGEFVLPISTGVLLPELVTSLTLLQLHAPTVLHAAGVTPLLMTLLDSLDRFNQLAPGAYRDNNEDLAWPGIWGERSRDTRTLSFLPGKFSPLRVSVTD